MDEDVLAPPSEAQGPGRVARRRKRNREALIGAGATVMASRGIDAATMHEIAEIADVGAGTVYSYFKSKEDLAVAVLEKLMLELALKIEKVTSEFDDPASIYAFGVHSAIDAAISDPAWKQLLYRSEVIAEAMFKQMGPFAIRDLENATNAGRFKVEDPRLTFRLATHGMVGFALAVNRGDLPRSGIQEAVVGLLMMAGLRRSDAETLVVETIARNGERREGARADQIVTDERN